jgi:hypothetical protein
MSEWKGLWKDVDAFAAKSKQQYDYADEEFKKLPGWKFKGCPDGLVWRASHAKERLEVTARDADTLVARVKVESRRLEERDRKEAEAQAAKKGQGAK